MGNKKGLQIAEIVINDRVVDVRCTDGSSMKVTRSQRNLLTDYKREGYVNEIKKAFSNDHIVANDFKVVKNGNVVFHL